MRDIYTQPEEIALEDSFVPVNHFHVQQQSVNPAVFGNGHDLRYWLPMFLSLGYWPTVLLLKDEVNDGGRFTTHLRLINTQQDQPRVFGVDRAEEIDISDMELAERMIPMINPQRFLREAFWLDIGKALYIADDGSENGLLSWIRHTERAVNG